MLLGVKRDKIPSRHKKKNQVMVFSGRLAARKTVLWIFFGGSAGETGVPTGSKFSPNDRFTLPDVN